MNASLLKTLVILSAFCWSCTSSKPQVSLNEIRFKTSPYIERQKGEYFLVYQIDPSGENIPLVWVLEHRVLNNKAYYYFSHRISHQEFGQVIKRPIKQDNFSEFVESNSIYWLNPDKSEVKLSIRNE